MKKYIILFLLVCFFSNAQTPSPNLTCTSPDKTFIYQEDFFFNSAQAMEDFGFTGNLDDKGDFTDPYPKMGIGELLSLT